MIPYPPLTYSNCHTVIKNDVGDHRQEHIPHPPVVAHMTKVIYFKKIQFESFKNYRFNRDALEQKTIIILWVYHVRTLNKYRITNAAEGLAFFDKKVNPFMNA